MIYMYQPSWLNCFPYIVVLDHDLFFLLFLFTLTIWYKYMMKVQVLKYTTHWKEGKKVYLIQILQTCMFMKWVHFISSCLLIWVLASGLISDIYIVCMHTYIHSHTYTFTQHIHGTCVCMLLRILYWICNGILEDL